MADIAQIAARVEALRRDAQERDARHQTIYDARAQKIDNIAPGSMPDAWPRPITANLIDTSARQLAENLAPLPSINCASGVMTSERAKKFVAKKTKIAYSYIIDSNLKAKMPQGCDWYLTYGSMPIVVDADFTEGRPRLRIDNPMKSYVEYDLNGRVRSYTKVWREPARQLAAKFPEHETAILGRDRPMGQQVTGDTELELVKFCDATSYVLYMPERKNLVLMETPNTFGKVPVAVARKPSYDDQDRGQYDDVVWPMLARNRMAMLGLQATQQTVRAPLAIPTDVQKIPFGDDAVIRTNSPEKIRRVGTDMPQAAWQQDALLSAEVMRGTRTPASATGDVDASIITGRGVDALNGGYDIQVATGQLMIGHALEQALELAFEMDEKFWPDAKKSISGVINGTPFEETYTPEKDIKGNFRVSVSYGFASGMNPNQALIFLLQLRGDQLVSRDFVQRQLPMDIDVSMLQAEVDKEQTVDALKQGIFALLSSVGIMAQQGMDPTMLLTQAAKIIELREKMPMHEAILTAFQPEPQPAPPTSAGGAPPGTPEEGAGVPFGINPSTGMPGGIAPGQAQMGPGGKPDVMSLLAGLTSSGRPTASASVKRSVPA
ncbi:hypothetical protein [Streptomyces himalayensis]|uniref:Portal protein n=1 Tax=Streptomyces himalayensis subsp. himalayensis TaxID=2756131 RepID=A0A7W0IDV1_9ACTN|nr:hypothetical protein [Streptomyces himalayensis]MBA2951426.1 hypothetical protein [Streptomyces himalayensis subsp. himalayensis]